MHIVSTVNAPKHALLASAPLKQGQGQNHGNPPIGGYTCNHLSGSNGNVLATVTLKLGQGHDAHLPHGIKLSQ